MTRFVKDPQAKLDYVVDWRPWLSDGETIAEYTVTPDPGITVDSDDEADGVITVWVSGGTLERTYQVVVHVKTSLNREDDRTMVFAIRQR